MLGIAEILGFGGISRNARNYICSELLGKILGKYSEFARNTQKMLGMLEMLKYCSELLKLYQNLRVLVILIESRLNLFRN